MAQSIEKGKDVKFSIDDLAACAAEGAGWDGGMGVTSSSTTTCPRTNARLHTVRNYGARNNMQAMKKGDLAFFYHSNCKEPGIVGIMEIIKEAVSDHTARPGGHVDSAKYKPLSRASTVS